MPVAEDTADRLIGGDRGKCLAVEVRLRQKWTWGHRSESDIGLVEDEADAELPVRKLRFRDKDVAEAHAA